MASSDFVVTCPHCEESVAASVPDGSTESVARCRQCYRELAVYSFKAKHQHGPTAAGGDPRSAVASALAPRPSASATDPSEWNRQPGRGKYARLERERRFLVQGAVPAGAAARLIEDKYLHGLRLRLRRVSADGHAVYKLSQKVRPLESDPSEVLVTNIYLSEEEFSRLFVLDGLTVTKTRSVVTSSAHNFVMDEFRGRLQGLRLAEVELPDLDEPLELAEWLGAEVTHDDRFSGGQLARLDEAGLRQLLDGFEAPPGRA